MIPDASRRSEGTRDTPGGTGRTAWSATDATPLRILECGRIRTHAGSPPITVAPGPCETALVCLEGAGWVRVGTERFRVEPYDTVYVPRDTHFMLWSAAGTVDIAEVRAPVEERQPLQYVNYAVLRAECAEQYPDADSRMCVLLGARAAAGRLSLGIIAADGADDPGPWPVVPDVPGAEVACAYVRIPPASQPLAIDRPASSQAPAAHVYEGDLVVGPHHWQRVAPAPGALAVLWMLAAEREAAERFRLPPTAYSRSRVVS